MDDYETCPKCKSTKKNKPTMRLMINVCAHLLCDSCVELLFFRGSGPCYTCKMNLKKNEFRDQVYEDTYVEKEVAIRKKHQKELTRSEFEFPTLKEFNDYLEQVETLIFNLANSIQEEETLKKIEQLKKEAKDNAKNKDKYINRGQRENPLYTYKPFTFMNNGPKIPADMMDHYAANLVVDASQLASGFPSQVPIYRLLQDAFSDLYASVIALN